MEKIIIDQGKQQNGVVPLLPLNDLMKRGAPAQEKR